MLNIDGSDDPFYRYTMPDMDIKYEGRGANEKTVIYNINEIAHALNRHPSEITKMFSHRLCTRSSYNEDEARTIVKGNHSHADVLRTLREYISTHIECGMCGSPETKYKVKKELYMRCLACGAVRPVADDRLNTFITKAYLKRRS